MFLASAGKLRKKLLSYLFAHTGGQFYVRELAGLVAEDAGNMSKELARLEKEGVLLSTMRGNLKLYCLNTRYPLFKEWKSIIGKSLGVEPELKKLVDGIKGVTRAAIYGSFAQGRENESSDIDVLIVGDVNRTVFSEKIAALEKKFNREINCTIYTNAEYHSEKDKTGGFLSLVLKGKTRCLKGDWGA